MKVARVFIKRTNQTPDDADAYIGEPGLFTPQYDRAYISCTFTWDIPEAKRLQRAWTSIAKSVYIGGPAFGDPGADFKPGMFLKKGVTITSRGCSNKCSFCFVPSREGKIREIEIQPGNIVQDNNLLACSKNHVRKVFEMLKHQRAVEFSGGLEASRITDQVASDLADIRIHQMWMAFDKTEKTLEKAVKRLSRYFKRNKIRCYVLIGYEGDTIDKARARLMRAWEIGTLPFAMLYRDEKNNQAHGEWRYLQRQWCRPAIIKAITGGDE